RRYGAARVRRAGTPVAPWIRSALILFVGRLGSFGGFLRRLLGSFLLRRRFLRPFRQRVEEWVRSSGSVHFAGQRRAEWHHAAVEPARSILVLLDDSTGQADSGKNAASARVGQHLRSQLPVGIGGSVPSHRASGDRRIGSQFEFAGEQILHAIFVHDQHDKVDGLATDLETDAAAAGEKKSRRAPATGGAATGDSPSVISRHDKASLEERRNHSDALGRTQNVLGNAFVGGGFNFIQNGGSSLYAILSLGVVFGFISSHGQCAYSKNEQQRKHLFHRGSCSP